MNRRTLIAGLGSAAAWPRVAAAQQQAVPTIGILQEGSPEGYEGLLAGFRQGLAETGFFEGRNMMVEYRWARFDNTRLPEFAADLVRRKVAAIATLGSPLATLAAKATTATIPIVFGLSGDPVELGLVASFSRPGGKVTGLYDTNASLLAKELGFLSELKLNVGPFAVLVNPTSPYKELVTDLQAAAAALGRESRILYAATNREIDAVFAELQKSPVAALVVVANQLFFVRRAQIVTLATRHALPVLSHYRDYVEIGGLMSYGSNPTERNRRAGQYVGRILKGEKPADLPVIQSSKYDFVINLQTARTLGIEISPKLLALADEVIE